MARYVYTWRKGLRWDKSKSGWIVVRTGRLLTVTGLKRRKSRWRKELDIPAPKPKPRRKPKPKPKIKKKPKPKPKKPAKPKKPVKPKKPKEPSVKKPKRPGKGTAKYFEFRMEESFIRSAALLKDMGYAVDYRTHINADGTVDGELRVKPKRGQSINDILIDLENSAIPIGDTWISSGVRYKPRENEEFYIRFMGMSQANTNYSRNIKLKRVGNYAGAREINSRMQDRGRRKPEQVITRIHWNKRNKQPGRGQ